MESNHVDVLSYLITFEELFNTALKSKSDHDYIISQFLSNDPDVKADMLIICELLHDSFLKSSLIIDLDSESSMRVCLIELLVAQYFLDKNDKMFESIGFEYLHSGMSKFRHYFIPKNQDENHRIFFLILYFFEHNYLGFKNDIINSILLYLSDVNSEEWYIDFLLHLKHKLPKEEIWMLLQSNERRVPEKYEHLRLNQIDQSHYLAKKLELLRFISDFQISKVLILKNPDLLFSLESKSILKEFLYLNSDNDTKKVIESFNSTKLLINYRSIFLSPSFYNNTLRYLADEPPAGINLKHFEIVKKIIHERILNDYQSLYLDKNDIINNDVAFAIINLLDIVGLHSEALGTLQSILNARQLQMKNIFPQNIFDKLHFINDLAITKKPESFTFFTNVSSHNDKIKTILFLYAKIKIISDSIDYSDVASNIQSNLNLILSNLVLEKETDNDFDIQFLHFFETFRLLLSYNFSNYVLKKDKKELEGILVSIFSFVNKLPSEKEYFMKMFYSFLKEIAYLEQIKL